MQTKPLLYIQLHGFKVPLIVTMGSRERRSVHYFFGIINISVNKNNFSMTKWISRLEKIFSADMIASFSHIIFYTADFVYIFGEIKPYINRGKGAFDYCKCYIKINDGYISIYNYFMEYLKKRVAEIEKELSLNPHSLFIRDFISKVGVHYSNGEIGFSIRLVHFAPYLIEAIIYHELMHDIYQDHSVNFHRILNYNFPHYKEYHLKLEKGFVK